MLTRKFFFHPDLNTGKESRSLIVLREACSFSFPAGQSERKGEVEREEKERRKREWERQRQRERERERERELLDRQIDR